jgi:hypothetical protein
MRLATHEPVGTLRIPTITSRKREAPAPQLQISACVTFSNVLLAKQVTWLSSGQSMEKKVFLLRGRSVMSHWKLMDAREWGKLGATYNYGI